MQQISLSKAALRMLGQQLELKSDGYTRQQLRTLDKVLDIIDGEISIYNTSIDALIEQGKKDFLVNPEAVNEINTTVNTEIEKLTETVGKETVSLTFEDAQFTFIKEVFDTIGGFLGNKDVRKTVFEIEDAISNVKTPAAPVKN